MKTQYVQITPIPAQVPRQLAIEILHSHGEIITLNPLVLDYHPIKAPRDCPNDEYYSTWYEISERIQFVPGLKKIGSSKVTFKGCFHDMPWGVQTHMYVPMGVDLRNKWQIRGSQPGEPPEPRELGSGAPTSGLYLREEVDIKCNPLALSFVKKEMKAAAQVMVERMIKKAELLDAGILQAMFENGKLKTFNPADRSSALPPTPQPMSPGTPGRWRPESFGDLTPNQSQDTRSSVYSQTYQAPAHEAPNQHGQVMHPEGKGLAVEMPGDFLYPAPPRQQNDQIPDHVSTVSGSDTSPAQRESRWSFMSSDRQSNPENIRPTSRPASHAASPYQEPKTFTAELPGSGHRDVENHKSSPAPPVPSQISQSTQQPPAGYQTYNPQNYARFANNGYT